MADGFDPCECIFNHEMAMRRLLSLLRSSQSYCTDEECLQDGLPGPGEGTAGKSLIYPEKWKLSLTLKMIYLFFFTPGDPGNFMMMMFGWMMMAMIMYFMRPQSMRNNSLEGKPQGPPGGNSQDPRDPPAVS